jgi:hypothetical protein
VTLRTALQFTIVSAIALAWPSKVAAQDPALEPPPAQVCPPNVAVTCPARREIIAVAGWAPESPSVGVSWTAVRRFGVYLRLFPGLDPSPGSAPDTTIRAESLTEFGIAYRLTAPITIGVGYGKFTRTDTDYGAVSPVTFRPTVIDRVRTSESGPSLFIAYSFNRPTRAIGLAASASVGVVGSGVSLGTTLRFPRVRAPIGQ